MLSQHFAFHPQQSVAAFAAHYPEFLPFWRAQGLPETVPAELSWDEACAELQQNAVSLLGAFATQVAATEIPQERDWTAVTLDELVDNLVNYHHVFVRTQLGRMEAMLKVLAQSAPRPSQGIDQARSALAFLAQRWHGHLEMEEREFFPACLRLESSRDFINRDELDELIGSLHRTAHDHGDLDRYGERLEQALQLLDGEIDSAYLSTLGCLRASLSQFMEDARVHAAKEDDILLPAVMFVHDIRRSDFESSRFSSS